MHDPAPKGMAHCSHSSIRAPQGPAHFPTVRRTVGTGRDADRPDVLFSSPMAHRVQLSRRLDKRKTPCFPARRLRGAADRIRSCGLLGREKAVINGKNNDKTPEAVRSAQLPVLVVEGIKKCGNVQTVNETGEEEGVVRWWSKSGWHQAGMYRWPSR